MLATPLSPWGVFFVKIDWSKAPATHGHDYWDGGKTRFWNYIKLSSNFQPTLDFFVNIFALLSPAFLFLRVF